MAIIIRNPIVVVVGHVDHGKTTLLDAIRQSRLIVTKKEAGGITQHIGATNINLKHISNLCGDNPAYQNFIKNLKVRGLLFIDTPGHEAFMALRKRGSSIADLAIVVIDINKGVEPQTKESIKILKEFKVPFVISANKVDAIPGWDINEKFDNQQPDTSGQFYTKFYDIIGQLNLMNINADIFTNFKKPDDYKESFAVVPIAAIANYGIKDLLMVLMGIANKFLINKLETDSDTFGEGMILEARDVTGVGKTIDVIMYNGKISKGDTIVIGGREPIITKVKNLLLSPESEEMRLAKKFNTTDEAIAACGIKIYAENLKDAEGGMPIYVCNALTIEETKEKAKTETGEISTSQNGVIIRTDTLGAVEAFVYLLDKEGIPLSNARAGRVTKEDVIMASAIAETDKKSGVIFVFNASVAYDVENLIYEKKVKIFNGNVIYKIIEEYKEWGRNIKKEVPNIAKIQILGKYIFRAKNPAVVGVRILNGEIKTGMRLMNTRGGLVGSIIGIEAKKGEKVLSAKMGEEVPISIDKGEIGKNIDKDGILYSFLTFEETVGIESLLDGEEKVVLEEIKKIKRETVTKKTTPVK